MLQFQVGDKAVYPAQGVGEIIGIDSKEIAGKIHRFYVLKFISGEAQQQDRRVLVPVERADEVGLRPVLSRDELEEVFDILRETDIHFDKQTWNRRYRGFMEKIRTGSLFEVAEVYRDLSRLEAQKTLSYGEKRMLETARNLVVKEISASRAQSEVKIREELDKLFAN